MLDFIYNEGSSGHRGVWHVTDNLSVQTYKALDETEASTAGGRLIRRVHPEYAIATGDAICGQVNCRTGGLDYGKYHYENKDTPEEVLVVASRSARSNYQRGLDNPPGPLCSRCEKKANIPYA